MPRFAHISDVHLGSWKQPELQDLNFKSFQKTLEICIQKKVDFILIVGDLFDSAYPPIEILKETFAEFKKLKEAKIPCFIVAGSHDFSVSGKTFLDVLEKAGFCTNVSNVEEIGEAENKKFILSPVIHNGIALYGYPGKKSGLEIEELRKIKLNESPGMPKIFLLHTTLDKAKGTLPIDAIEADLLPKADYYALGHLHIDFQYENFVYPGPIFPNNFQELEDLQSGSFYIVDIEKGDTTLQKIDLGLKKVEPIEITLRNALTATDQIIAEINKRDIEDKIVLLRIKGELENGKHSDIKFPRIEEHAKSKGAYFILKNTHELKTKEMELDFELQDKEAENVEEETINLYSQENPSDFNALIPSLINALGIEKQEDEKTEIFNNRVLGEARKILRF